MGAWHQYFSPLDKAPMAVELRAISGVELSSDRPESFPVEYKYVK